MLFIPDKTLQGDAMNLSTLKTALQMSAELYGIQSFLLDCEQSVEDFCSVCSDRFFLHFFTPEKLQELIGICSDNNCLHITDELLIHYILFRVDSTPVILGPFSPKVLSDMECHHLLSGAGLHGLSVRTVQTMLGTVPKLSEQTVLRIVHAVLTVTDPSTDARNVVEIGGLSFDPPAASQEKEFYQENYNGLIQRRYQIEQHFLQNIAQGNTRAAIHNFHNMHQSVAHLKQTDQLQRERIGAAVIRTLIRIAAFSAGLPAITIDLLSSRHTIAISRCSTQSEMIQNTQKTIREFCEAIREKKTSGCSNLVLSAKEYLDSFYTQDITLQILCDELSVSPNCLITGFREELGITPMHYLRKIRLDHACRFLIGTDLLVSQISSLVGIPDSNYFSRIFRKTFHMTPAEYRRQYRI